MVCMPPSILRVYKLQLVRVYELQLIAWHEFQLFSLKNCVTKMESPSKGKSAACEEFEQKGDAAKQMHNQAIW